MDFASIDAYLRKLHSNDTYAELQPGAQQSVVFTATELLTDYFGLAKLTDRIVALQVLYMLEGEGQEFEMLKRQGVKSYNTGGTSVSFTDDASGIAPAVLAILGTSSTGGATVSRAFVGSLI